MSTTPVQEDGRYRTSDLYYAAYLRVARVPWITTVREGRRVFFIFERIEGLDDLKQQFFNRTGKVEALTYADEIKAMKSLTHSQT